MRLNPYLRARVSMIYASTVGSSDDHVLTTELDSHANMIVVGAQATIISRSGKYCQVQAFSKECAVLEKVPIVDAIIAYDCPSTDKKVYHLLVARNALHVPSMTHNLIPPFIMREAGLVVNDVPRIHCGDGVTRDSHCIIDNSSGLRIPLRLRGIFSYFETRKLTPDEVDEAETYDCIELSPESAEWDPSDDVFSSNEDSFLDFRGELKDAPEPKRRKLIYDDDVMASSYG